MKHASHPDRGERGYALVAAVASIALFAMIALAVLTRTQRVTVSGFAEVEQARAAAAAEAGIAVALDGLMSDDLLDPWSIGGRPRAARFGEARLQISVVDERGKVPLNLLEEGQVTNLLEALGYSGQRLRVMRDSYLDWIDDDDEARPDGAEIDAYRGQGLRPRNGGALTVAELGRIRGFDVSAVARIAPIATVDFGAGSFDTRFAQPLAIGIMYGGGDASPDAIRRAREMAGQTTAFEFIGGRDLVARPLTISVTARLPSGASARRSCVVELTGADLRPYVIRHCG